MVSSGARATICRQLLQEFKTWRKVERKLRRLQSLRFKHLHFSKGNPSKTKHFQTFQTPFWVDHTSMENWCMSLKALDALPWPSSWQFEPTKTGKHLQYTAYEALALYVCLNLYWCYAIYLSPSIMIRVGMDDVGETLVHKNVWVGWILYVYTQIGQPSNIFVWINLWHRHVASKEGRALLKRIITCIRPRQSQPLPWVHAPTKTRDAMSHIKN